MKNKKKAVTRKQAIADSRVPTKLKKVKPSPEKLNKFNQWDFLGIDNWVKHFEKTKRLPSTKITCCECRTNVTSMFGNQLQNYLAKHNGNIRELLETYQCRPCRNFSKETIKAKAPKEEKEKKPKVQEQLSREEYEARKQAIRDTLPKFNANYETVPIDLVADAKTCAQVTYQACWRPDIFLNLGCSQCILQKNCACPIKDLNRIPDNRPRKFKRAVLKVA